MSGPTRVLAEGTLRYLGSVDGGYVVDWMTARVFVLEYEPGSGYGSEAYVTVVAREPVYLPYHRIPGPVGSIHRLPATDGSAIGDPDDPAGPVQELLTLDIDALVPA